MLKSSPLKGLAGLMLAGVWAPALALAAPWEVSPNSTDDEKFVRGRIVVQPRAGVSDDEIAGLLAAHGGKVESKIEAINVHVVDLPERANEKAVAALLAHHPKLEFAEVDRIYEPAGTANDPYFSSAWHLGKIGVPTAWDSSTGSGITVAILDTGVDSAHPDLAGQLVAGWNAYDNNTNTADVYGHGTSVAGTVAAATNNSIGVASIAYRAKIMPVRICNLSGYAVGTTIAQGLIWAADHGAKVANISFGGVSGSSEVKSAANYFRGKGGLTVVSAENTGTQLSYSPSADLIAVSATDSADVKTSWSSYGNYVDIAAPGLNILTTARGGGYSKCWGTSFSSPVVAGTVALMMAANPMLAPGDIERILLSTAVDLGASGWDSYYGNGRVNASAAVLAAKSAVAGDTTAPSVAISSPSSGATVSGTVAVNVFASDNVGVSRVELFVGGSLYATSSVSPYGFSWNTASRADGSVSLVAKAYDAAGNSASSSAVSVTVKNTADGVAPVVNILSPANGAVVKNNVTISASATDNVGVVSMKLYVDGVLKASSSSASISTGWNTRKIASGSHTIRVDARDASGNVGTKSISVTK